MRFYGQNLEYWLNKDTPTLSQATQALEILEAKEDLRALEVCNYSDMKKETQTSIFNKLTKAANPEKFESRRPLTMADFAKQLAGSKDGNG